MTDSEINVAIAEACGWTRNSVTGHWRKPVDYFYEQANCPDYCADLNAMHEAEKTLPPIKASRYVSELWSAMCKHGDERECELGIFHATARQRAEAFLRCIGKWKD